MLHIPRHKSNSKYFVSTRKGDDPPAPQHTQHSGVGCGERDPRLLVESEDIFRCFKSASAPFSWPPFPFPATKTPTFICAHIFHAYFWHYHKSRTRRAFGRLSVSPAVRPNLRLLSYSSGEGFASLFLVKIRRSASYLVMVCLVFVFFYIRQREVITGTGVGVWI